MIFEKIDDFIEKIGEKRLISLDVGSKTIGIAISDETRTMALPVETLIRRGNQKDFPILLNIFKEKKVGGVVIGLPLSFNDLENKSTDFVKRFSQNLSLLIDLPIFLQDERLTSFEAEDLMLDKVGFNGTKKVVDKIAASYILSSFLENLKK